MCLRQIFKNYEIEAEKYLPSVLWHNYQYMINPPIHD